MDEEKTIDEAVEDKADEMKEFEPVAFDEVIKDEPVKESAPVLRDGGDPEPADMNMIHKHLDNFLAMLCGETPIDDNVRNSTEYWLKRLADRSTTKPMYRHCIGVYTSSHTDIEFTIYNHDSTPFTFETLDTWFKKIDPNVVVAGGPVTVSGSTYPSFAIDWRSGIYVVFYVTDTGYDRANYASTLSASFSNMQDRVTLVE